MYCQFIDIHLIAYKLVSALRRLGVAQLILSLFPAGHVSMSIYVINDILVTVLVFRLRFLVVKHFNYAG